MKVAIIQRILPHYRVPLFYLLYEKLESIGIEFQLIYGQECVGTVPRTINIDAPWAIKIDNNYIDIFGKNLVWQPCMKYLNNSDLIIFEQANSLLLNYWLILKRCIRKKNQLAFWGHGKNMQSERHFSLSEKLKETMLSQVDWWFAYTDITSTVVHQSGFPPERVTVLENAVDTSSLKSAISRTTHSETDDIQNSLGLSGGPVALYCGGMYANKKLDFLIESSVFIKKQIADFQIIFIGDGPDQGIVENAAHRYDWIHYPGPKFDVERAVYFKMADVFLMPGLVGLAILDGFTAGLPIFTTNISVHSPEIDYLEHGENGFMSEYCVSSYANSVISYLTSSASTRHEIKKNCLASADQYTLENMADRFTQGIEKCLMESV
jgi:glycosyltransferase involved in cell wall biosynthesis